MTTQQNPNNQNTQGNQSNNLLHRFIQPLLRNRMLILAATLGGIMSNMIGLVVDFVQFKALISPKTTEDYESRWILVKITGHSVAS
ncbi:hypothetical protein [Okeania sp.]|uniref:hypothetical protein n=1 Tax=Okeania sp. TaxID=3100323 RepID=UPI002B4AAFBD|nr:hypothetical protein [Okeania sp.]MEB3342340.1 hypothetical protein [Okeania sp.]